MRTFVLAATLLFSFSSLLAQQPAKKSLSLGTISDNTYRNFQLGFKYTIVLGWVDRTSQNRADADSSSSGKVLLSIFEHPPEVKGENVNPAVVFAAESLSSFPEVKTAADYFGPLTEASTAQGFKVVNEPYQTILGAKTLVRSDFTKQTGKVTMYQSSLVMLSQGYAISFTFIGDNEDEVEQLISRLSFAPAGAPR
ncbi:MAG TPA: hypothetical protein VLK33_03675 [Terriglobales bacterium]|nr:hypothetical protein [Terriglobales bacterium]